MCFLYFLSFMSGFCNWLLFFYHCTQKKIFDMTFILLNLLRFILKPKIWSTLVNVSYALEMNVYSSVGWNALKISTKSTCSYVSFEAIVSLLIFCLKELSIDVSGVLKSIAMTILLSNFFFKSITIRFIYLDALMLGS